MAVDHLIPQIIKLQQKKLVGKHLEMSFSDNRTALLWSSFMPRLREIGKRVSGDLISLQVYSVIPDFSTFNPAMKFEKWAATEVSDHLNIPDGMEAFTLEDGWYAVFHYRGSALDAAPVFRYIFGTWLPGSVYMLDHRPHFEVLGEKYNNNSPDSEEDIWIPVKHKEQ